MSNRAYSVAAAYVSTIGVGTAAGADVQLGRARPWTRDRRGLPDPTSPKLYVGVNLGPVETLDDDGQTNVSHLDLDAAVYVDLFVEAREADWMQAIYDLAAEVHALIMADYTLGLSYVVDTDPLGFEEPELDDDGDQVRALLRMNWRTHFRTSVADLGA
ncbi:MAG: hypothetical protein ACU85V_00055 [Gammaproteobacteria bacterium]